MISANPKVLSQSAENKADGPTNGAGAGCNPAYPNEGVPEIEGCCQEHKAETLPA